MNIVRALAALTPSLLLVACGASQQTSPDAGCLPATELCNGVDDDCDGEVDEGFALAENCTAGIGACAVSGTRGCTADGSGTLCSAQPKAPAEEACNGVDDDCDGTADEGVSDCCQPAASRPCGTNLGACREGTQLCGDDRAWGPCLDASGAPVNQPGQTAEACNALDDDCDGETDEGFADLGAMCGTGQCSGGTITCTQDGSAAVCSTAGDARTEICDGIDDDCDGMTDEEIPSEPCDGPDADVCQEGTLECVDSQGLICSDTSDDTVESCNGLDDDCDGLTDEEFAVGTSCGEGECAGGTLLCAQDGAATVCSTAEQAQPEVCNVKDDDCDGETDESC